MHCGVPRATRSEGEGDEVRGRGGRGQRARGTRSEGEGDASCGLRHAYERILGVVFYHGKWTRAVDCDLQVNVLWELCSVDSPPPASSPDTPDSRRATDTPRPRLVCVLDASLSMRESYGPDERLSKIDRVKIFAQLLVKTMSSDDWLGLVTYGTDARVVLPLQKLTDEVKVRAYRGRVKR